MVICRELNGYIKQYFQRCWRVSPPQPPVLCEARKLCFRVFVLIVLQVIDPADTSSSCSYALENSVRYIHG